MELDKKEDDKTGQNSVLFPAAFCETLDGNSNKSRDNEMGIFLLYSHSSVSGPCGNYLC